MRAWSSVANSPRPSSPVNLTFGQADEIAEHGQGLWMDAPRLDDAGAQWASAPRIPNATASVGSARDEVLSHPRSSCSESRRRGSSSSCGKSSTPASSVAARVRSPMASSRPARSMTTDVRVGSARPTMARARRLASGVSAAVAASTASIGIHLASVASSIPPTMAQARSSCCRRCRTMTRPRAAATAPPGTAATPSVRAHAVFRSRQSPVAARASTQRQVAASSDAPVAIASASSAWARCRAAAAASRSSSARVSGVFVATSAADLRPPRAEIACRHLRRSRLRHAAQPARSRGRGRGHGFGADGDASAAPMMSA